MRDPTKRPEDWSTIHTFYFVWCTRDRSLLLHFLSVTLVQDRYGVRRFVPGVRRSGRPGRSSRGTPYDLHLCPDGPPRHVGSETPLSRRFGSPLSELESVEEPSPRGSPKGVRWTTLRPWVVRLCVRPGILSMGLGVSGRDGSPTLGSRDRKDLTS